MWLSSFQVAGGPPARSSLNSLADGVAALQMFRPDIVDGAIALLAFNLRIEPADLRNPVARAPEFPFGAVMAGPAAALPKRGSSAWAGAVPSASRPGRGVSGAAGVGALTLRPRPAARRAFCASSPGPLAFATPRGDSASGSGGSRSPKSGQRQNSLLNMIPTQPG